MEASGALASTETTTVLGLPPASGPLRGRGNQGWSIDICMHLNRAFRQIRSQIVLLEIKVFASLFESLGTGFIFIG